MENMRFKVGDRVRIKSLDWYNENKDSNGNIVFSSKIPHFSLCVNVRTVFTKDMVKFCGKVITIESVWTVNYSIGEGTYRYYFTDEMIEGLVEEKPQSKFNIGDVVYSQAYQRNVIIKEIRPYRLYKVGDLLSTWWFIAHEDTLCKEIVKSTNEYTLPDGYIFKDENGNVINATKIVLEKKKWYPITYCECKNILGLWDIDDTKRGYYKADLIDKLQMLLICRDAYWKIAGEEKGLEKPWELSIGTPIYYIYYNRTVGTIKNDYADDIQGNVILAFPTEEMRDAFYENFKEEIEICKELL